METKLDSINSQLTEIKLNIKELFTTIKYIEERLNNMHCTTHDKRIRDIENKFYKIYGVWTILIIIIPTVINMILSKL